MSRKWQRFLFDQALQHFLNVIFIIYAFSCRKVSKYNVVLVPILQYYRHCTGTILVPVQILLFDWVSALMLWCNLCLLNDEIQDICYVGICSCYNGSVSCPLLTVVSDILCLTKADAGGASGSLSSPVWWVAKLWRTGGSGCSLKSCAADHHRQHVLPCDAGCTATGRQQLLWPHTVPDGLVMMWRNIHYFYAKVSNLFLVHRFFPSLAQSWR